MRREISSAWTSPTTGRIERSDKSTYTFGGGIGATNADYRYSRVSQFSPEVALAFGRAANEELNTSQNPHVVTFALYGANRRRWSDFEAELGLRVDAQHYERDGNRSQVSPRLNLRYDLRDDLRLYASAGRFTQAQHVEEWRVEEAQQRPDAAQVSIHSILGLEYEPREWRPYRSRGLQQAVDHGRGILRQRARPAWRCFRTSHPIVCASCRTTPKRADLNCGRVCPSPSDSRAGEHWPGPASPTTFATVGMCGAAGTSPVSGARDCLEALPRECLGARRVAPWLATHAGR